MVTNLHTVMMTEVTNITMKQSLIILTRMNTVNMDTHTKVESLITTMETNSMNNNMLMMKMNTTMTMTTTTMTMTTTTTTTTMTMHMSQNPNTNTRKQKKIIQTRMKKKSLWSSPTETLTGLSLRMAMLLMYSTEVLSKMEKFSTRTSVENQ